MTTKTYDINIEATVIGSLINTPMLLKEKSSYVKSKLFFLPSHKNIINTILDLHKNNIKIDIDIIRNKINKEFENDLLYIMSKSFLVKIDDYLEILEDYSIKREMQSLSKDISTLLQTNSNGLEIQSKVNQITQDMINSNNTTLFDISNIEDIEDKKVDFICKNWLPIPRRTVSLITAPGGTGKSWLIQQLAIRAIQEGEIKKAFLWLSEDPKEISKNRFNKIYNDVLNINNDNNIKEKIDISDSPTIQFLYDEQRKVEVNPLFYNFKAKLQNYDLIILDPLIAFYGTDENNNSNARRFMQLFTSWANKENKTIIFIHHSTKNTTQSRGASAFVDTVRTVYEIVNIKDKDGNVVKNSNRIIKLSKDNYGIYDLLNKYSVKRKLFPSNSKKELEDKAQIPKFSDF